jgi:ribosomal protein L35AE/L33A
MAITKELLAEIGKLSSTDDIREVWSILKQKHARLCSRKLDDFYVGQDVSFEARNGEILKGRITKINVKTATVKVGMVKWNVAAAFLRPVPRPQGSLVY